MIGRDWITEVEEQPGVWRMCDRAVNEGANYALLWGGDHQQRLVFAKRTLQRLANDRGLRHRMTSLGEVVVCVEPESEEESR